jgi:hypothetical protein
MSDFEKDATLKTILLEAAKSGKRMRFYGPGMLIIAEGLVAFVGDGVVAISHSKEEEPDEYVSLDCIIKIQVIGEYRHY